jgi:hypothetical protein
MLGIIRFFLYNVEQVNISVRKPIFLVVVVVVVVEAVVVAATATVVPLGHK